MSDPRLPRSVLAACVFALSPLPATTAPALPPKADPGWLRLRPDGTADRVILVRPDGTGRTEQTVPPLVGYPSPDGKATTYIDVAGDERRVRVADVDGRNARPVAPADLRAQDVPCWSPDGKRVAFIARRAKEANDMGQLYLVDWDGKNLRQVTAAPKNWAWNAHFVPDGRVSYLTHGPGPAKDRLIELAVADDKAATAAVRTRYISDHAWSPDGKVVAYGRPGALVFLDVGTSKEQVVAYKDIDPRVVDHMATLICWSPDGKAVVCTIAFFGDRQANGPPMFGDDELFVVPRSGKPAWFRPDVKVQKMESVGWVKRDGKPPR